MYYKIFREYPDPVTETAWERFLPSSGFPSHYTSPAFFSEPFWTGKNPFAVLVFDREQEIIAVATGISTGGQLVCGMYVRPQVVVSPDANNEGTAKVLFEGLRAARMSGESQITLYSCESIAGLIDVGCRERLSEGEERSVIIDLGNGADAVFEGFSSSRRNNLRKAIKKTSLKICEMTKEEELMELYPIHVQWCKTKLIAPTNYDELKQAWQLKSNRKILIAKHDGKVIAGSYFRFCPGGIVEYAGNNSNPEFLRDKPNDLLMWEAIKWACESGFRKFSMGGSHTFLQRFGGEITNTCRYQADLSRFQTNRIKDEAKDLLLGIYRTVPNNIRQKAKRYFGIGPRSINPDATGNS